jgi:hypothetical protein
MQKLAKLTLLSLVTLFQPTLQAQDKALLSSSEQKSLRTKLAKLIQADREYADATGSARDKAARTYDKAKDAFQKEWDGKVERKGNLLASVPDLTEIFDNIFEYDRGRALTIRKVTPKGYPAHGLSVPKAYKNTDPVRSIVSIPGESGSGFTDGVEWFKSTWGGTTAEGDTLFHVVMPSEGLDFDRMPDFMTEEGESVERKRIADLLMSLGETLRSYNLDRNRMFLDASKGNCAFALRFATYFPERFAGIILRHPTAVDEIRIGSLSGVPVLLLSTAETAAVANALKGRFDELKDSKCTVLEAKGSYPFLESAADIEAWMDGVKRDINRSSLVIEPNHDQFHHLLWAAITRMDPVHTAALDKRPRIELTADRQQNRIVIDARGVESVFLMLNDSLIDLDKEFTMVINGKAVTEKRSRDFNLMKDTAVTRFDGNFLFPVQFNVLIPAEEGTDGAPR